MKAAIYDIDGTQVVAYTEPDGDDLIVHRCFEVNGVFVDFSVTGTPSGKMTDGMETKLFDAFASEAKCRAAFDEVRGMMPPVQDDEASS
ncbi:hypothetical protein U0C82_03935 [Fulvimarina sp. 2208YS6-2-32]|uniref:KTSC domain-containing protein n=1 Tax=Fulvimarina uroteuthidis TaxID=3098149 RepID=A0ABU5HYV5_9HYPH|nr:hypothetical protein [Fulvimarina sp. 2208YS6-2-32]MDY8108300.1 hypothetical protein [Fulvimarina sp. 2208YS6-2-32]